MSSHYTLYAKTITITALSWLFTVAILQAQEMFNSEAKKGSYSYYGNLAFEDNSFLLDEAFTQEKGVMQYISNIYWSNLAHDQFMHSFTHEIPLGHNRHQLSYSLSNGIQKGNDHNVNQRGLGDTNIMYSYMVWNDQDWIMVAPELNIILPTGDPVKGLGNGGLGCRLNIPMTKRFSRKLVTHYNFAYTFVHNADRYVTGLLGENIKAFERDLYYKDFAASVIWYPIPKFNTMFECISKIITTISPEGAVIKSSQLVFSPGFRFAFDINNIQVVPGISTPVIVEKGAKHVTGLFIYLSFEPDYRLLDKQKH